MPNLIHCRESPPGAGQAVLELVHGLLARSDGEQPDVMDLLGDIAEAFDGQAAGLASLPDFDSLVRYPDDDPAMIAALPWQADPNLIERASDRPGGTVAPYRGGAVLLCPFMGTDQSAWLLWVEDLARSTFSESEQAALGLVACALSRWQGLENRPRWAGWLDHQLRQRQLESAAAVTRRLAHDFGNILTGILGFAELALAQQTPASALLHSYLEEVHRAAQQGAHFTQQLRLFSRQQATSSRGSHLAHVFAEQEARQLAAQPTGLNLRLQIPADLPPVALAPEHLHQVLSALLDNAREALAEGGGEAGAISVFARPVELDRGECDRLFGATLPGPHVEITIADTGVGLTPEAQRRVLAEPFYTNKPRRKGFGLSVSYGILAAHHGGIRLYAGEERGVVVRILLPVAAGLSTPSEQPGTPTILPMTRNERILVVDDEPDLLRFVSAALQQEGYRVHCVGSADGAYHAYFGQANDPFALVLSDVETTGVELAQRLLRRDPRARVAFMSAVGTPDLKAFDLAKHAFAFLPKPFRAETLLQTVRTLLEGGARRGGNGESARAVAHP